MLSSIEIAQLLMAKKKKKKEIKKFNIDGALLDLGVAKKERKKN